MTQQDFIPALLARQVILVDEYDQELGTTGLIEAHRGEGLLHRAASALLFRQHKNQLQALLQRRSFAKIVAAGQWANTACGNLAPGEGYRECIDRRLQEELGIVGVELTELSKFHYSVACEDGFSEREMDMVFAGWYDGSVTPNQDEVLETQWAQWENGVDTLVDLDPKNLSPWFTEIFASPEVSDALTNFLKEKL